MTEPALGEVVLAALDSLSHAFEAVVRASGSVDGHAHGALLEVRADLGEAIRRTRNIALFVGANPARVGEASSWPPS